MLDKKCNIFTGNIYSIKYVYKIINYLDLLDYNYTAFIPNKPNDSYTKHTYLETFLNGHIINYKSINDLNSKLINKSNFFKTNLTIIDAWNLYILDDVLFNNIKSIDTKLILLVSHIPLSISSRLNNIDLFELSMTLNNLELKNLSTNISSNVDDLIKSDIRDIKIRKLFE
jgi:hypothetical protein